MWAIRVPPTGNTQTQFIGGKEEHMDLGGYAETCQHKSLSAPRIFGPPRHRPTDRSETEGGSSVSYGDIRGIDLIPIDLGLPPQQ